MIENGTEVCVPVKKIIQIDLGRELNIELVSIYAWLDIDDTNIAVSPRAVHVCAYMHVCAYVHVVHVRTYMHRRMLVCVYAHNASTSSERTCNIDN